jgi:hypothetical protein
MHGPWATAIANRHRTSQPSGSGSASCRQLIKAARLSSSVRTAPRHHLVLDVLCLPGPSSLGSGHQKTPQKKEASTNGPEGLTEVHGKKAASPLKQ